MKRRLAIAACAGGALVAGGVLAFGLWVRSLPPLPRADATGLLGRGASTATAFCLRPYATAEGRWRLKSDVEQVDPRYLAMLIAYEDKRFRSHRGVDPIAMTRAAWQWALHRRDRLGRIDHHHAGCAPARAAQRTHAFRQAPADGSRDRTGTRDEQGRDSCALSLACSLWRQSGRRSRRFAGLFRQGAEAAVAGGGRASGGLAAIAGSAAAGSLGATCKDARDRVLDRIAADIGIPSDEVAAAKVDVGAGAAQGHARARAACRRSGGRCIAARRGGTN